jgi:hypothetical protein
VESAEGVEGWRCSWAVLWTRPAACAAPLAHPSDSAAHLRPDAARNRSCGQGNRRPDYHHGRQRLRRRSEQSRYRRASAKKEGVGVASPAPLLVSWPVATERLLCCSQVVPQSLPALGGHRGDPRCGPMESPTADSSVATQPFPMFMSKSQSWGGVGGAGTPLRVRRLVPRSTGCICPSFQLKPKYPPSAHRGCPLVVAPQPRIRAPAVGTPNPDWLLHF